VSRTLKGGAKFIGKQKMNLLYNKYVLFFFIFVTFFNLVSHALSGNYIVSILFILVAFLTSFFSKNMIVILVIGLVTANLVNYGPQKMQMEGFTTSPPTKAATTPKAATKAPTAKATTKAATATTKAPTAKATTKAATATTKAPTAKATKEAMTDENDHESNNPLSANNPDMDKIKQKYQELLKLQEKIMSNVGSLEESFSKVNGIVGDVQNTVESMKSSMN
jgi:cytoskeletal protein RodZ